MREEAERVLRCVPADFPLCENPYGEIAGTAGMSASDLIDALRSLRAKGVIRRIAAILYHRRVAYTHNAMVVWKVPAERVDEAGTMMASFAEVSHCYERETGGYWDFNLYTMIHGRSMAECVDIARRISRETGVTEYRFFVSTREFKKTALVVQDG